MSLTTTTKAPSAGNSAPNNAPDASPAAAKNKPTDAKPLQDGEYNGNVPMDLIEPDPKNRDKIDDAKVKTMSESIASDGLLQPVVLRLMPGGNYRLIAGEHRWRAFKLLKRPTIPARIYRNETEVSAARKKTIENFQRVSLTPIEEARKYRELADLGMKQTEIGTMLGKSQPVIANAMRLLDLPADVQAFIRQHEMTMAHGVSLCRFAKRPKICLKIAELAVTNGSSAKSLDKGLPFAEDLAKAKLVTKFDYMRLKEMPDKYRSDPDFIEDCEDGYCHETYCMDPEKGKAAAVVLAEKEKADRLRREVSSSRTSDGKMTESALAERKKKIASNKRKRVETKATLDAGLLRLKRLKGFKEIDGRSLAVIVHEAMSTNQNSSRLSQASKDLEITLPKGLVTSSWNSHISMEKIQLLSLPDIVRLAAWTIASQHAEGTMRAAFDCPKEAEMIAGGKKAAPAVVEGKLNISDQVRAKVSELAKAGRNGAEIAKSVGISLPAVQNIKKALGLIPGKPGAAKATKK